MKIFKVLNTIFKAVPKIDPVIEKVTESVVKRRIVKGVIRVLQIAVATYLLYKGLINAEDALDIIKG